MIPEVQAIWNRMRADREAFRAAVEAVPADKFDWRPLYTPKEGLKPPPCVRELVLHVVSADRRYCHRMMHSDSDLARVPLDTPYTKEELLRMLDELDRHCEETLEQITPEMLPLVRAETWGSDPHGPHTTEFFVRQINRHRYYHAAQVNYIHLMLGIE